MTDIKAVDIERIRTFVAVRQAARPARRAAFALALPLVAFLVVAFVAPILYSLPIQLLAYHTAVLKGTDVDQPRNLAKSVTVE